MRVRRKNTIIVIFLTLYLVVTSRLVVAQDSVKRDAEFIEAITISQKGIQLDSADDYNNHGDNLFKLGKLNAAIAAYKKAIELDPDFAYAYNGLGNALYDQKTLDPAISAYKKAIELDPDFAYAYNGLGNALYDQRKLDDAIDAYKKVIELDPEFAYAYNGLGNALYDQKKLDDAIGAYKKVIELNPKFAYAHNGLGNALYDQNKLDAAIGTYKKAIEINPKLAYAHNGLGNALYDQNKLDDAIGAFQTAIKLKPNFPYAYNGLGNSLRDKKKLDDAIGAFQTAIKLKPDFANAYNGRGLAFYYQNKLQLAINDYKKAIQLNPGYADAYYNLGIVMINKRQFNVAVNSFQKTIKFLGNSSKTPCRNYALAHNGLGFVFQQQGELEKAIEEFDKAEDIDSSFVYASYNNNEARYLWGIKNNALAKVKDDSKWLDKKDPSVPMKRSVVHVTFSFSPESFSREGQGTLTGTGIIIQRKANRTFILTNYHVIFDNNQQSKNIQVEFFSTPPEKQLRMRRDVKLFKYSEDKKLDLAVLEVIGTLPEDIKPIPISSNQINPKTPVRIVGHFAKNQQNGDDKQRICPVGINNEIKKEMDDEIKTEMQLKNRFWSVESREINSYNKQKLHISKPVLETGFSGSPVTDLQNQLLGIVLETEKSKQESFAYPMSVILQQLRTWKVL